jgi:hypothetical protein
MMMKDNRMRSLRHHMGNDEGLNVNGPLVTVVWKRRKRAECEIEMSICNASSMWKNDEIIVQSV